MYTRLIGDGLTRIYVEMKTKICIQNFGRIFDDGLWSQSVSTMKQRDVYTSVGVLRQAVLGKSSPINILLVILVVMKNLGAPGCAWPCRAHDVPRSTTVMYHVPESGTDIPGRRSCPSPRTTPTNISEVRRRCTMVPMRRSLEADALLVAGTPGYQLVVGAAAKPMIPKHISLVVA